MISIDGAHFARGVLRVKHLRRIRITRAPSSRAALYAVLALYHCARINLRHQ